MEMQIFGNRYHILMIYQNGILFTLDTQEARNMPGQVLSLHQEHQQLNGRMLIIIYLINSHSMLQRINGIAPIVEILVMSDLMLVKEHSLKMDLIRMKKTFLDII